MKKALAILLLALIVLISPKFASAAKKANFNIPTPPSIPTPPDIPDLPEIPEFSGIYRDPVYRNLLVRVYVHDLGERNRHLNTNNANSCEDPQSSAVVDRTNWRLPASNWYYNLNPSSVPASVGTTNLSTISGQGFSAWTNILLNSSSDPTILRGQDTTKVKNSYDRLNIIAWGRTSGRALATTYIRYYTGSGLVVDVDTIMNNRISWSLSTASCGDPNSYDAQGVLTHEQGHWFGLDDEYSQDYINNTMYGYGIKGDLKARTLTLGDELGVQAIYP